MVIEDLYVDQNKNYYTEFISNTAASGFLKANISLANIQDRFVAFFIDFLLMSPLCSFLSFQMLRELKKNIVLHPHSSETLTLFVQLSVFYFFLWIFIHTACFYFAQATPGQRFLKLKVISLLNVDKPLTWVQSFHRAWGFSFSLLLVGLPFLEIFKHPWRRSFHDKVSDTLLITLKKVEAEKIKPIIVTDQVVRVYFLTMASFVGIFVLALFLLMLASVDPKKPISPAVSPDRQVSSVLTVEQKPDDCLQFTLEEALEKWQHQAFSGACLKSLAEKKLWSKSKIIANSENKLQKNQVAYAIQALTSGAHLQNEYWQQTCREVFLQKGVERVGSGSH